MAKVTFSRVQHDTGNDATDTPCKRVDVFLDGESAGYLYREPCMLEWCGNA